MRDVTRSWRSLLACCALGLVVAGCARGASRADAGPPLDAARDAPADAALSCPIGASACDGACTSLLSDPEHCGACGAVCAPGTYCVLARCRDACPEGQVDCEGRCWDLAQSRSHCGACGAACALGEVCSEGACATSCRPGVTACDGDCVALATDPAHCGACGRACADGERCSEGVCRLICGGGSSACDGACVDTRRDPAHCGGCGVACPPEQVCSGGACADLCGTGLTDCGDGACRSLDADPAHCGACGAACGPGRVCDGGACAVSCEAGTLECAGGCVDARYDPESCGGCGVRCTDGAVCNGGACDASCGPGLAACDGACRDRARDRAHCGACGVACADGERCVGGACAPTCGAPLLACGDACVDPRYDPAHCGGCDQPCGAGDVCFAGVCGTLCGPGFTDCDGACRDLENDRAHCGACGVACGDGEICARGACALSCGGGRIACDAGCVDPYTDPAHCGGCGRACGAGEVCTAGVCDRFCGPGLAECGASCRDLETDRGACGGCGNRCAAGEVCAGGLCEASCGGGSIECGGACVDPAHDPAHCGGCGVACAAGEVCDGGRCALGCGAGLSDCGGACRDLSNDPAHCGACDAGCEPGRVCRGGACALSCGPGGLACDGACVDPAHDPSNCGGCGVSCAAGQACVEGACAALCPGGQIECGGRCVDPGRDPSHCGGCGRPCASGEACAMGACALACPPGQTECAAGCHDLASDPDHCGACGAACGSTEVCSAGACDVTCADGLAACAGACVDPRSDPLHCGGCDPCPAPDRGIAVCSGGRCTGICDGGRGDCNADLGSPSGDGCETDLASSAAHCGGCGFACVIPNGVGGCVAGACEVVGCDMGYADCDAAVEGGCEAHLATDERHCGACGAACPVNYVCEGGRCSPARATGEDCDSAIRVYAGSNSVFWEASRQDYLFAAPSCISYVTPDAPDVVLLYTATGHERIDVTMSKPTLAHIFGIASSGACGALAPELACLSGATSDASMQGAFVLRAGETVYFYVAGTSFNAASEIPHPLSVTISRTDCTTTPTAAVVALAPLDGSVASSLTPDFSITFDRPIDPGYGSITFTGDRGTLRTLDLTRAPSEIAWGPDNRDLRVPMGAFLPNERVSVSWELREPRCQHPVPSPSWTVTMPDAPCAPGLGGVVGSRMTRVPTDIPFISEYYMVGDAASDGFVWLGGPDYLRRVSKVDGTSINARTAAGASTNHLGYAAILAGASFWSIADSHVSGVPAANELVYRFTRDGGASWSIEEDAVLTSQPTARMHSAAHDGTRGYLLTFTGSASANHQIWTFPLDDGGSPVPAPGVLERTFTGQRHCSGLAMDATYYYAACTSDDQVIRVDRVSGAVTVLASLALTFSQATVVAHDIDADGAADVLYVQGGREELHFLCDPQGPAPHLDRMAAWAADPPRFDDNYGLAFDPVHNVLWAFDDDTLELIRIE